MQFESRNMHTFIQIRITESIPSISIDPILPGLGAIAPSLLFATLLVGTMHFLRSQPDLSYFRPVRLGSDSKKFRPGACQKAPFAQFLASAFLALPKLGLIG